MADTPTDAPATRSRRRLVPLLLGALGAVVALLALVTALGAWLLRSEGGAAWLAERIAGVRIVEPRGALLPDFAAQRIEITLPAPPGGTAGSVVIESPRWRGLQLGLAGPGRWLRLTANELQADRVTVQPAQGGPKPTAPTDLRLPFELAIAAVRVGELRVGAPDAAPMREVRARLALSDDGGRVHRLDDLALAWRDLAASGSASIATTRSLDVQARLQAAPANEAWRAEAALAGPLAQLGATVSFVARPLPGRPEPKLDAQGTLRPFAAWPIGQLTAQTQALDLAALDARLPATSLSGNARVTSEALDRPATIEAAIDNALAGLWSDTRLPVRSLRVDLAARPDDTSTLEVRTLEAQLGSTNAPAGVLRGAGTWRPEAASLQATLDAVQPSRLDARAPAMRLSGPVRVELQGRDASTATVDASGELAGRFAALRDAPEASLRFALHSDPQAIVLREARLAAGAARADAALELRRPTGDGHWRAIGRAEFARFDPLPWWPGPDDARWRRGPHRLDGQTTFDLTLPDRAWSGPARALVTALRGTAEARLAPSVLSGVPIEGELRLRSPGGPVQALLAVDSAGNRIRAEGRFRTDARADGRDDRWDLTLDAPAMARLAPLARLFAPNDPAPTGSARASVRIDGRWPAITSDGRIEAESLRAGPLRAQRANARWSLGTAPDAPLQARVELARAGVGERVIDAATLTLDGTARAHRLALQADSSALPPAWAEDVQAATGAPRRPPAKRSLATVAAEGGFIAGSGEPTPVGWRGRIARIELRGDNGAEWLRATDLSAEGRWAGGPRRFQAEAGRATLLGAALRWDRIAWQEGAAGAPAQIEAKAELEPLAVAPVLARLQPSFGWGGDLAVGGRLDVTSAPEFRADVVLERARGDLTVTDEVGTQALGLTDLRLGLVAAGGTWSFTQALAGSNVGVVGGAVVARTAPQATWPADDTPIEGVLELRVANLGTWGTWVPAGWRLGGALRVSASIGGRFGAPEYTGEVRGEGLTVRNFVEGVAVSDGEVAIALRGATARIERFTAKAGDGTLRLEGDGTFGEAPRAELRLVAQRFQVLGRVDRRIVASGNARLQLTRDTAALDGRFDVDAGLIDFSRGDAPSLSDDVVVIRPKDATRNGSAEPAEAPPAPPSRLPQADLNLRVGLGEQLRVRGRGLETGLRGELQITSPGGRLAVNGTVRAEGGTYAAYGQKLSIDKGLLVFTGAANNPRLDIEATRPNIDVRAGVSIVGNAIDPRIRLFSEPDMSDMDKLSWLVLGRASDGLGSTETALLQRAALALLSGEGQGPTDQLFAALGLDEVSVRRSDGEVRDTVVSLGKQLSRRWYVGYERGLNATTGNWQLIYRIARRFTLRAQAGNDNALDAIFTWRWQ